MLDVAHVISDDELVRWVNLRNRLDPLDACPVDVVRADLGRPEPVLRVLGIDGHGEDVIAARAFVTLERTRAALMIRCTESVEDNAFEHVLAALEAWAWEHGVPLLDTYTYDFDPVGLRRYAEAGWNETPTRKLAVGCRPADMPARSVVDLPGLEYVTLAERPDLAPAVHDTWNASWATTPWAGQEALPAFERWWGNIERWPGAAPDQFLLVVDGPVVAGYTELTYGGGDDRATLWHAYTGVRPEYRRRGIARALKVWSIEWARARGVEQLVTSNDEDNLPMRAINAEFGYEPQFSYVSFEKSRAAAE